jgi:mannitol 2-dehydrogenase
LPPVPGIDLARYKATLLDRFSNPAIRDTVRRVNTDAPVNLLLDPLRDRLATGAPIDLLSLGLAAWCRRVHAGGNDPIGILSSETLFGQLGRDARLVSAVRSWLTSFTERGVAGTMAWAGGRDLF